MEDTLNSLKRAHCAHKRHSRDMRQPNFKNFTYSQFNYWETNSILGVCSSNVNPTRSVGQNCLYKAQIIEECLCRSSEYSDREMCVGEGWLPGVYETFRKGLLSA